MVAAVRPSIAAPARSLQPGPRSPESSGSIVSPWLSGAIYFALQEFRVRPNWDGGNPRPQSPIHQKGLVSFDGVRKPAFFDVQRIFRATKQFRAVPRSGL